MAHLLDRLERVPPFLCRILARKNNGHRGLSHEELAKLSGLSRSTIAELSFKTSWKGVTVDVADRFAAACGINHHRSIYRQVEFLKWRAVAMLKGRGRGGGAAQRQMYHRLFGLLKDWGSTPKSSDPLAG